jgi:hypothetical protein
MNVILTEPFTESFIRAFASQGHITAIVTVDLEQIVDFNKEQFVSFLSEKIIGTNLLKNVSYTLEGNYLNQLILKVNGDVSHYLAYMDSKKLLEKNNFEWLDMDSLPKNTEKVLGVTDYGQIVIATLENGQWEIDKTDGYGHEIKVNLIKWRPLPSKD